MTRAEEAEAELSASRAEVVALREALEAARQLVDAAIGNGRVNDQWARNVLVQIDTALAGEKPVGAGVETLATDYLRGKIGEIIALQLDIEGGRAVEQAVEQILAVAALSKSGEKP